MIADDPSAERSPGRSTAIMTSSSITADRRSDDLLRLLIFIESASGNH
jgi:hypothetical protein